MHITLEANYAIQTVEYLAKRNEKTDAKTIAEHTEIPLRFLLKILRKLVHAGVLESFRGTKGGYVLAKKPEEITMRSVIEAVEGPYMISRCQKQEYACGKKNCRLHEVYDCISSDIQQTLDSYNFAQVCKCKSEKK